jgi:murein DD-endopeptidase MepM/ murein hydrolase activator NlpD
MPLPRVLTCLVVSLTVTAALVGQQSAPAIPFTAQPPTPRQGSLVTLLVTPPPEMGDSVVAVQGEMAGEPLHFERRAAGGFRALGGVPLDAPDTIAVRLVLQRATGGVDTAEVRLRVARRRAVVERIATAPRFVDAPDSTSMARIMEERELARAVARGAHEIPRLWVESFIRPRPRASRVTSPFGIQREVNGKLGSKHQGVDVAGAMGAPVRAANRGVVALVGDFYYGGISVYVCHGAGLVTAYHHLSRAVVAVGDTLERGQLIGRVGATGRVTGPHLHWGAQYGKLSVDPVDLLTLLAVRPD